MSGDGLELRLSKDRGGVGGCLGRSHLEDCLSQGVGVEENGNGNGPLSRGNVTRETSPITFLFWKRRAGDQSKLEEGEGSSWSRRTTLVESPQKQDLKGF